MSYPCHIIQDLLPSYVDGLCSTESQQAVEEHVRGCEPCRQTLDAMQAKEYELPDPAQNLKKKRPFQKLRNRVLSLIMAVVLVCGSVSVFFLYNQNFYYQYLHWGDRIHIDLTVNGIDESVPIEECVAFSYTYIGDDLDAPSRSERFLDGIQAIFQTLFQLTTPIRMDMDGFPFRSTARETVLLAPAFRVEKRAII